MATFKIFAVPNEYHFQVLCKLFLINNSSLKAEPPKKCSENDLVDNLLNLIDRTAEPLNERPFFLNKRIEIDLDEIEEPYQNIPSSPLLIKNENSFSYSSILVYMKKKFNLNAVSKLEHSVCGVKRVLDDGDKENIKENSENYSSPDTTEITTYKKVKKSLMSATKEMDEENIKIDLTPPLKISMHKARPLEVRKNLNFEDEKRNRLSADFAKKLRKEPDLFEDNLGYLLGIADKENVCSFQERASIKMKMNQGINMEKIEAES